MTAFVLISGFGYVPVRSPPAETMNGKLVSGATDINVTRPLSSTVIRGMLRASPYVPADTPEEVSFGAVIAPSDTFDVMIELSAIFWVVIAPSAILMFETEPSAIFGPVTAPSAIVGFGYVPVRSPPAGPRGGSDVGITPAAIFSIVTAPSEILTVVIRLSTSLAVVITLSAILAVVIAPSRTSTVVFGPFGLTIWMVFSGLLRF